MDREDTEDDGTILVTGATGLVGKRLLTALPHRFATIRTLSRSGRSPAPGVEAFGWDGIDPDPAAVEGTDAIVHLSGEPIFGGLPTQARMDRIRSSRVDSTRALVDRIAALPDGARPSTLICASAVGYYGDRGEEALTEESQPGDGALAEVCVAWEAEALRAAELGVRVVRLRIGVVLSREGGALALMRVPFLMGVGGRLGSGAQFFPWIHLVDLVSVIGWLLDEPIEGVVNAVAPEIVSNRDLTRELGRILQRPTFLPLPSFALKTALGPIAGELLGSRRVVPARLEAEKFVFRYPTLASALEAELP